jgi:hypothetical protein
MMTKSRDGKAGGKTGKLTEREGILWDALLAGRSLRDAAREAGYSEECLGRSRWRILQGIKATMHEILVRCGLTDVAFVLKLKALVNAKERKFFAYKGKVVATRRVEALGIQVKALDMWAKIAGYYKHPEPARSRPYGTVTIVYNRALRPGESPTLPGESGGGTREMAAGPRGLLAENHD